MKANRREFLLSTAGVSALGLTGYFSMIQSSMAASVKKQGYYSWKVGSDIEVISIYDGIFNKPHDENFIVGATIDDTKQALRDAGLNDEAVPIEFAYTVIKSGGKTILVDAGTGGQLAPTAGLGSTGMANAGIKPGDIDIVLISHCHPDHIFGLMEKETNTQLFPDAQILVGETELTFWTDPGLIEKLPENGRGLAQRIQATFPSWNNVSLYQGDQEVAPGVRSVNSFGHTPGHTAFHLASGDDEAMLLGDLANIPALFLANLDWQVTFDMDKDAASNSRKQMIERAVADELTVAGYHFGFPNSGKIKKDGSGYVFEPTTV